MNIDLHPSTLGYRKVLAISKPLVSLVDYEHPATTTQQVKIHKVYVQVVHLEIPRNNQVLIFQMNPSGDQLPLWNCNIP